MGEGLSGEHAREQAAGSVEVERGVVEQKQQLVDLEAAIKSGDQFVALAALHEMANSAGINAEQVQRVDEAIKTGDQFVSLSAVHKLRQHLETGRTESLN